MNMIIQFSCVIYLKIIIVQIGSFIAVNEKESNQYPNMTLGQTIGVSIVVQYIEGIQVSLSFSKVGMK